jgi:azurin
LDQVRFLRGFDYKSQRTFCGLPLLNVSSGMDPATGKPRVARGIIAIGSRAYGWFAFGGVAGGGVAVGGVAAGIVAIGGCAAGLVAIGGCALALLVAIGGLAVGYFGLGGQGFGMHVADGTHTTSWLSVWVKDNFSRFLPPHGEGFIIWFNLILCALIVFPILMTQWARRKVAQLSSQSDPNFIQVAQHKRKKRWRKLVRSVLIAIPIALFLRTFVVQPFVIRGDSAAPEIPRGSWILAWKLTKNYAVGDFIVYLEGDTVFLGKVTVVGEAQLHVIRFGHDNYVIPREKVLGWAMFNTRPSTSMKEPATDSAPQPSVRVESKVVIPVTTMKDLDKGKTKTSPAPLPKPVTPEPIANGKIRIGVRPAIIKFDIEEFTVASGTEVTILFSNEKCPLQHNLSILRPGTLEVVTAAADRLLSDPDSMKKNYFPDVPEILVKGNKLVGTGQNDLITFTAPAPGDYPYVCTFPGHIRLMRGVMRVVSPTNSSPNGSPE